MLSKKMTVSLMSLITILALGFIAARLLWRLTISMRHLAL